MKKILQANKVLMNFSYLNNLLMEGKINFVEMIKNLNNIKKCDSLRDCKMIIL